MARLRCRNAAAVIVAVVFCNLAFAQRDAGEPPATPLQSLIPDDVVVPAHLFDTLDQLTFQMGQALREGETRVVWLVDRSASLRTQRETIARMIPAMVAAARRFGENTLETVVVGYGADSDVLLHLPDTSGDVALEQLTSALTKIADDQSGSEYLFSGLIEAADSFAAADGEEVLFFVLTDEPGDDDQRLEEAIAGLKAGHVRCFLACRVTPFLSTRHYVNWTYDDGFTEEIPIDAGSETALPQRVHSLPLSPVDPREFSSGFAPWPLARLCAETGGSYLANHSEFRVRFESADLALYAPDTRHTLKQLDVGVAASAPRQSMVNAVRTFHKASVRELPRRFTPDGKRTLVAQLRSAQRAAAVAEFHLTQLCERLDGINVDRDDFVEPRWRADYDLSYARVLAARVRLLTYNLQLARMKSEPVPLAAGKDTWILAPAEVGEAGPNLESAVLRAETELQRVIDAHPGTPWAAVAERELAVPLGWQWAQD